MHIREDGLNGSDVRALLKFHLEDAYKNSPADGVFALDIAALKSPEITFWTIWQDDELCGCGALKRLSNTHGEIKSMRSAPKAIRRGAASAVLSHIITQAKRRGFSRLSLETGSSVAYMPAQALYTKFGFEKCGPFADYKRGAFSTFMTLGL